MFRYISKLSVWEVYLADSLKAGTRSKQGQGQLCKVLPLAPLPSTWKASWGMMRTRVNCFVFFSKKLKNKFLTKYSSPLAETTWSHYPQKWTWTIWVDAPTERLHAAWCVKQGRKKILIWTADTDVALAVSVVEEIKVEELWVAFRTGKDFRYIATYTIASSLGADKSRALPAIHAVTDHYTVSFCGRKGKLKAHGLHSQQRRQLFLNMVLRKQICQMMHLRRLSNLLCPCMKRTVQWQQWMQQGKSCSPNDAKPSRTFPLHRMPFVSTLYMQRIKQLFGARVSTEHQDCHFHPPGDGSRTKGNHGSNHYGQAEDLCYELIHCGCKQDASVQLPASHVLPYATVDETSLKTSLMIAFKSSSWRCMSCCNFISVHVMNILSPVWPLDCDFWIDSIQIFFLGFHWNTYITISYIIHKVTVNTIKT